MKKLISLFLVASFITLAFSGCSTPCDEHIWSEQGCLMPKVCTVCGAESEEITEHKWEIVECLQPKVCSVCGEKSDELADHYDEDGFGLCSYCGKITDIDTFESIFLIASEVITYKIATEISSDEYGAVLFMDKLSDTNEADRFTKVGPNTYMKTADETKGNTEWILCYKKLVEEYFYSTVE